MVTCNLNIDRAREIAEFVHGRQADKAGRPYIVHCERVATSVRSLGPIYEVVAWLHDVLEDSDNTRSFIENEFGTRVADAVDALTHKPSCTYTEYLLYVGQNDIARRVKLADLDDNLSPCRPLPPEYDSLRKRYTEAKRLLLQIEFMSGSTTPSAEAG